MRLADSFFKKAEVNQINKTITDIELETIFRIEISNLLQITPKVVRIIDSHGMFYIVRYRTDTGFIGEILLTKKPISTLYREYQSKFSISLYNWRRSIMRTPYNYRLITNLRWKLIATICHSAYQWGATEESVRWAVEYLQSLEISTNR